MQFFNNNLTRKQKLILFIVGSIILTIAIYYLNELTNDYVLDVGSANFYYNTLRIGAAALAAIIGALMIIVILEFRNNLIFYTSIISLLVGLSFYNGVTRAILLSIIVGFALLCLLAIFFKLYSTVTTMSILFLVCLLLFIVIVNTLNRFGVTLSISPYILIYVTITLFLIAYQFLGVWINRFYISVIMQKPTIGETYSVETLKSHINLIYVVGFIFINATGVLYIQEDFNFYNIVNNCFLTAIALNQIRWSSISW
ncbi:hypothetical protein [Paenibacillus massiliensis]|uniref:hypothetical protein n=1 Tax=Paenibacillus massiliensis TaxID=225917 RepID=UPI000401DC03|nr:hypothetical protein [Paenibacillus massiliensis]